MAHKVKVLEEYSGNERCEIEVAPGKKVKVEYNKDIFGYDEDQINSFKQDLQQILKEYYEETEYGEE